LSDPEGGFTYSAVGNQRREELLAEARYDGLYVLRTNLRLHPLHVMLRYRDLLVVEQLFRSEKALLATRPIYHQTDAAIRGHVFCSFPCTGGAQGAGRTPDRRAAGTLLADLDRLQEIEVEQDGKHFILRTPVTGVAEKAFQAIGMALPPNIREAVRAAAA
jgi:hypothetical protein